MAGGAPPAGAGAVRVRGLAHAFGAAEVLADLDLDVGPGRFVAVLGPSGCGKSTLLRVVAGLVAPLAGTVAVDGHDVAGRPGRCAYQPQRDALLPWRRVVGNAALGAELAGVDRAEARARATALLGRFGLAGFERAWPAQLSGGMRQRVAIARTFLTGRAPLLLDEPFGALDALTRRDLYGWLEEVWEADRRSALLVTHDVDEALTLADEVVVLSARPGRVVAVEPVAFPRPRGPELLTDPAWAAARARLLAALRP
ncbi:MAG TPA: ABC transporter ATP-binding protein [Acidimicrobiales bacterium]|nr:ABC transporter ATP-binding protein [Acidimicrobiales bacterium]